MFKAIPLLNMFSKTSHIILKSWQKDNSFKIQPFKVQDKAIMSYDFRIN